MADSKVTELVELTAVEPTDIALVIDDPGGSPIAKKATVQNLIESVIDAKGDLFVGTGADAGDQLSAGSNGQKLVSDSSAATGLKWIDDDAGINYLIGNGVDVVSTGLKGFIEIPVSMEIEAVRLVADASGSIVVDLWLEDYANFPPADADSITASAPPTLSSAQKSEDTTLTGWTKVLPKGEWLAFNVDSATTVKLVTISITGKKTAVA